MATHKVTIINGAGIAFDGDVVVGSSAGEFASSKTGGRLVCELKMTSMQLIPLPCSPIRYIGSFRDGKMHGRGKIMSSKGAIYDGEWLDSTRHGYGVYTTGGAQYAGIWDHDVYNHYGIDTLPNGDVYQGQYVLGKPHGHGVEVLKDERYQGQYNSNVKDGYGELTTADGSTYYGQFKSNMRHGKGRVIAKSGEVKDTVWSNGADTGKTCSMAEMMPLVTEGKRTGVGFFNQNLTYHSIDSRAQCRRRSEESC